MLDYMITVHLYNKYPGMSPGMLTDLRSASVNNDCYAQSAVKCDLHKHILHGSHDLHRAIVTTVHEFDQLSLKTTFGWESETSFPKVSECSFCNFILLACSLLFVWGYYCK